jgi:hypothetical protein
MRFINVSSPSRGRYRRDFGIMTDSEWRDQWTAIMAALRRRTAALRKGFLPMARLRGWIASCRSMRRSPACAISLDRLSEIWSIHHK